MDAAGGGGAPGRAAAVQRPARPVAWHRREHLVRAAEAARTGRAACRPALLRAPAPRRLPVDRGGQRSRGGAAPAGVLGGRARRPSPGAGTPRVRDPGGGPLVLPDLRSPRRGRAAGGRRPLRLEVSEEASGRRDQARLAAQLEWRAAYSPSPAISSPGGP